MSEVNGLSPRPPRLVVWDAPNKRFFGHVVKPTEAECAAVVKGLLLYPEATWLEIQEGRLTLWFVPGHGWVAA